MNIFKKTWELLHYFEWNIAIRPHFDGDFEGEEHPYHVIRNNFKYWSADPFLFEHNESTYLFVEAFDKFMARGMIGYRKIENGKISKLNICLKTNHHMSYPYIYKKDNEIFMLPECFESGKLTVYRAISFPDKWEPAEVFLDNIKVCDSNYVQIDDNDFLLTMPLMGDNFVYDKLNMYIKSQGTWKEHPNNPVVFDSSCARNAGKLFYSNGKLMRPSQNCLNSYGESLVLNSINELSDKNYKEEKVEELHISNMHYIGCGRFDGIHTLSVSNNYDAIDLRKSSRLQLQRIFYLIRCRVKRG